MAQINNSPLSQSAKPIFPEEDLAVQAQISEKPIPEINEKIETAFHGGVPKNLISGYSGYGLLGQ